MLVVRASTQSLLPRMQPCCNPGGVLAVAHLLAEGLDVRQCHLGEGEHLVVRCGPDLDSDGVVAVVHVHEVVAVLAGVDGEREHRRRHGVVRADRPGLDGCVAVVGLTLVLLVVVHDGLVGGLEVCWCLAVDLQTDQRLLARRQVPAARDDADVVGVQNFQSLVAHDGLGVGKRYCPAGEALSRVECSGALFGDRRGRSRSGRRRCRRVVLGEDPHERATHEYADDQADDADGRLSTRETHLALPSIVGNVRSVA